METVFITELALQVCRKEWNFQSRARGPFVIQRKVVLHSTLPSPPVTVNKNQFQVTARLKYEKQIIQALEEVKAKSLSPYHRIC